MLSLDFEALHRWKRQCVPLPHVIVDIVMRYDLFEIVPRGTIPTERKIIGMIDNVLYTQQLIAKGVWRVYANNKPTPVFLQSSYTQIKIINDRYILFHNSDLQIWDKWFTTSYIRKDIRSVMLVEGQLFYLINGGGIWQWTETDVPKLISEDACKNKLDLIGYELIIVYWNDEPSGIRCRRKVYEWNNKVYDVSTSVVLCDGKALFRIGFVFASLHIMKHLLFYQSIYDEKCIINLDTQTMLEFRDTEKYEISNEQMCSYTKHCINLF